VVVGVEGAGGGGCGFASGGFFPHALTVAAITINTAAAVRRFQIITVISSE
jgi:hypothetical protein